GEHHLNDTSDGDCWDVDVTPGSGLPTALKNAMGTELRATARSVYRDGNVLYLEWEFLYHPGKSGSKSAVLCKYNSEKNRDVVKVGELLRTDYQTLDKDQFDNYFSDDPATKYTDKMNPMDNLKPSDPLYPNTQIVYGYYNQNLGAKQKAFLEKYFPEEYAETKAAIDAYNNSAIGDDVKMPADLKITPRLDLKDDQKIEFYCEHNNILNYYPGITFTLALATDRRLDDNGTERQGNAVYVAQSETKDKDLDVCEIITDNGRVVAYALDENGCLARKDPVAILDTIGEYAFANVQNVGKIIIPDDIAIIGDHAFEGAGMREVELNNDAIIGNCTFRNCTQLTSVKFGADSGTYQIGAEAFYGCSQLTTVEFPWTMKEIGYGAFANCEALANVDFSKVNSGDGCRLGDFAFYDDKSLTDTGLKFEGSNIVSLGKGCFALKSMGGNSALTNFTFPQKITGSGDKKIGEYVLANREKLTEVTMPENYQGKIPSTTFYNCNGLHCVIFPDSCGAASFDEDLFAHVTDESFFVRGPELYNGEPSQPRKSTWYASTRVSGETGVPYVYTKDGQDCYEVAMKSGDNVYRYEIDTSDGTLKSCVIVKRGKDDVDIVIPKEVGNCPVVSIGQGCFDDEELRRLIKSITIQDDSITAIDDEAFLGLPKLEKVRIGNSVERIGARAFADCNKLENVYFNTPRAGYGSESFRMDETAFQTGGRMLTFHGDIVKGYAPFEYAMNPNHVLKNPNDKNEPAVNVCYQSLWNSDAEGTHLTVMVDTRNGDAVLLDYPKLPDLSASGVMQDEELKDYCADMERYYYDKVYDVDSNTVNSKGKSVGELRREYAGLLAAALQGLTMADLNGDGTPENAVSDAEFEKRYGPWINERFLEVDDNGNSNWANWLDTAVTGSATAVTTPGVSIKKWLNDPYFTTYPYNFMENYQLMQDNPSGVGLDDYKTVGSAKKFIDGTETIIVPDGITSIDVTSYADDKVNAENAYNYDRYIGKSKTGSTYIRDTSDAGNSIPGLFSGRFVDYRDESGATKKDPHEEDPRGNDVVKRVVLRSIKSLPDYAFDNCEQLKTVELGAVSAIGVLPFRGCDNMTELIGNESYPVEKGILFERQTGENLGKYKIIECLTSKGRTGTNDEGLEEKNIDTDRITLLRDVNEIAKGAFDGCDNILLADFTGVDNLKEIPEGCFKDCTNLADVVLPVSVNKIKEGAFEGVTQSDGKHILDVTIRGREVDIADNAFSPKNGVIIRSYIDSAAKRYADRYHPPVEFRELGAYRVKFFDYDGTQVGATQELEKKDGVAVYAREPEEAQKLYETNHRPGYAFYGDWLAYSGGKQIGLSDPIEEDLVSFIAQYESNGTTTNGQYVVEFYDGVDGSLLPGGRGASGDGKYYVDAGMSFADLEWDPPAHKTQTGYEAFGYSDNWTVDTVIDRNMSIIALYKAASGTTSGGTTPTSGGTTPTSRGTTSGNSGNTSGNSSNSSSSSSSTSSTSTSSTSATSGTSGAGQYTVFVENGSGSGTYTPGTTVIISASIPAAGMRFDKWTTESNGVTLASVSMAATTFTMPSNNVTVKANYVADNTTVPTAATGTGNTVTTNGTGNTRVDIEKPGISNRDLATATTNGSSDNFIVKISETDEATRAVAAALTNKYGTLDNILYYAMDISLYDSTGTTKITDTTGLSVDITIPIPDSLVAYGGNNMAGAVINGDQLESLNESFTTINGVPCIRFRATHFSPYTIYVDTGNLVEGMLDVTPKTGDPIHPKWFLSLGLACLSAILFLKRDKKVAVKA
ncbi:MAG: leucine-rich repeat protein, partial [bacterium]|nr:leucine-rich repeat protein [bacterium]